MKTTWGYRIWQIVYPIGIYYVVSSLIYFALELLIGTAVETYMLRQLVCAACTDPGHAAVLSAGCRDPQYGLWQKTIETGWCTD